MTACEMTVQDAINLIKDRPNCKHAHEIINTAYAAFILKCEVCSKSPLNLKYIKDSSK